MIAPDITVLSAEPRLLMQQLRDLGLELVGFTDTADGFEARLAIVPWVAATGQPAARPVLVQLVGPDGRPGRRITLDEAGELIKKLTNRLANVIEANARRQALVPGAVVQVVDSADDGTAAAVGCLGVVLDGEVDVEAWDRADVGDADGVPVSFQWPTGGMHGRIHQRRLKVIGRASLVPVHLAGGGGEVITIEDKGRLDQLRARVAELEAELADERAKVAAYLKTTQVRS